MDERANSRMVECACTQEEIVLNRRLYEECVKDVPDFDAIEALLKRGADPLGPLGASGDELTAHVYGEIIADTMQHENAHLPKITALFLTHGMDIDRPRIPYDHDNSLNPMWELAFASNENTLCALGMLLDRGLSADSAGLLWKHALTDLILAHADPVNDGFWRDAWTWAVRVMMLCASYEHIGEHDEVLRKVINCAENSCDLRRFRSWDDLDCRFSVSPDEVLMIRIIEKKKDREIWRLQLGGDRAWQNLQCSQQQLAFAEDE